MYLCNKGIHIYVEQTVYDFLRRLNAFFKIEDDKLFLKYSNSTGYITSFKTSELTKVDLIVAFGGDGLLLYCNTLFGDSAVCIPPAMCFDFGSLGFLSPFNYDNFVVEVSIRQIDCFPEHELDWIWTFRFTFVGYRMINISIVLDGAGIHRGSHADPEDAPSMHSVEK